MNGKSLLTKSVIILPPTPTALCLSDLEAGSKKLIKARITFPSLEFLLAALINNLLALLACALV